MNIKENLIPIVLIVLLVYLNFQGAITGRNWNERWECLPDAWTNVKPEDIVLNNQCILETCEDAKEKNNIVRTCQCNETLVSFYYSEQFNLRKFTGEF